MCYKLPDQCISRVMTGYLSHSPPIGGRATVNNHFISGVVVARKRLDKGSLILIKEDAQTWHARYPEGMYRVIWHPDRGPGGAMYQGTDAEADAFRHEYVQRFEAEVNSAMAL